MAAIARRARVESPAGWPAVAALGGLVAILMAGVFEYNLGDSEVLMLALLLTSLPFARRTSVLPLAKDGDTLRVAVCDPHDTPLFEEFPAPPEASDASDSSMMNPT